MEYVAFVFAIFGFFAYTRISSLERRISRLEEQLTKQKGTSYAEKRASLTRSARSYIGRKVNIDLKEDQMDIDIISYGNTKNGSNTILDVDDSWMLVRIDSAKGTKEKLIRLESVERLSVEIE